jgi:hypothetical protein
MPDRWVLGTELGKDPMTHVVVTNCDDNHAVFQTRNVIQAGDDIKAQMRLARTRRVDKRINPVAGSQCHAGYAGRVATRTQDDETAAPIITIIEA